MPTRAGSSSPEDVTLVEGHDDAASIEGIVVWQRRPGAEGYGHIPPPYDGMADYVVAAAKRRARRARAPRRLARAHLELVDLRADGTWTPQPLRDTVALVVRQNDVSKTSRELLSKRFNMTFA